MLKQLNREISSTMKFSVAELQKQARGMALTVHLLCFTRWRLFVVFYVCVVSRVIKSLYIVFAPNKHVSFIFHKFNLCAQLIFIIHGCSFCLPNFRTSSFTCERCQKIMLNSS